MGLSPASDEAGLSRRNQMKAESKSRHSQDAGKRSALILENKKISSAIWSRV
jgi:hypothetical protein